MIARLLLLVAGIAFALSALACGPAAAMDVDCLPTTATAAGHFDGDGDQRSDPLSKDATHHHAPCSGHVAGLSSKVVQPRLIAAIAAFGLPAIVDGLPQHASPGQLRPPIA